MRQWRPWTLLPSAVPNTKTDHRLPGSSRRPKMATAYTGWLGLTLGPGLWQRNGTVAKRCLGLTLSRNRTLFTRKYPWQVGKSCRTKWHRRYGHYTLPRRGLRVNQLTETPQSPYLCGFNMLKREDRPVGGKSIEEHWSVWTQRKNTRRKCFGKHCVGVPSLLCSSFVVWFLLPLYHSLTKHMFISEHSSVKKKLNVGNSCIDDVLNKVFLEFKLAPDGFIHLTGAPTTFNFYFVCLFTHTV